MAVKRNSYIYSGVLHVAVAAIAIFGLPNFWKPPEVVDTALVVDLVPIGLKTNPPPKQAEAPQPEPAKPEPPNAEEPKTEPNKPEQVKTPPPPPTQPPHQPKPPE
ncbi:MAG: cell envelope integrity protein TolA, partial [Rhodospirillaceae bacterium]|nr:cell envelope integrity protein TolA [Rhodospirillales bacterium]